HSAFISVILRHFASSMPAGLAGEDRPEEQKNGGTEAGPPLHTTPSTHFRRETTRGGTDVLEGLDNEVVVEIIDRIGSSEEDDVEYLLQCINNRQQWVKRNEWLDRYPECQPMADIYELCRNNQRKKKQMKHDIRCRAENRRDGAISPSSSDEGQASSDTYDSPNRKQKRRERREQRRKAQEREAAMITALNSTSGTADSAEVSPLPDFPTSSTDLNPRSPPKRVHVDVHPSRRFPPKVIKVDEVDGKHKRIVASFVPGKRKEFYTKGQYDCTFDMITFSALIDKNAPERIFNHKIASILGSTPENTEFLVVVLQRSCDIANEMVEAIFPDMTLALSRETLAAYAPKALRQYEMIERLQQ
ncbi:hypothetical protein PMAYCL1PPCAC_30608, partial [Pristionchus mayeri]